MTFLSAVVAGDMSEAPSRRTLGTIELLFEKSFDVGLRHKNLRGSSFVCIGRYPRTIVKKTLILLIALGSERSVGDPVW